MTRPRGLQLQQQRRQQPAAAAALLLLAAAACLAPVSAIFEDQAGTYDWYKQYVGRPRDVAFLPGREQLYLASQQNLLASLGGATGSVAWRRKYTQQDALDALVLVPKPPLVAAASNGGKYVRAWDAAEGGFRWEALVFEGPPAAAAGGGGGSSAVGLAAVERGGQAAVAVAAGGTVKVRWRRWGQQQCVVACMRCVFVCKRLPWAVLSSSAVSACADALLRCAVATACCSCWVHPRVTRCGLPIWRQQLLAPPSTC